MRVFACEFVTGGGLAGRPLAASLCREGDIMLRALVRDLADVPGVEVVTTRDRRLPLGNGDIPHFQIGESQPCAAALQAELHWMDAAQEPWDRWQELMNECDAVWPIAPETGGVLERFTRLVEASGRRLLGSPSGAVRLTASKRRTSEVLAAHAIPVVPTLTREDITTGAQLPSSQWWVLKPDDGAGAADTHVLRSEREVRRWAHATGLQWAGFVVQPYIPGAASSLSLLCRDGAATLLACNSQDVRLALNRLHYRGGVVGGREDGRALFAPLAARIAEAIPALAGYVGVDLVESAQGPLVLEINPRLTTSYVGLRAALGVNPAALVLDLFAGAPLPLATAPVRSNAIELDHHAA